MSMTVTGAANIQMGDAMRRLSTMNRINSAADDAAGLAIAQAMEAQIRGLDRGTDNTLDMQNLVRTAEGGLAAIDDGLQRVRELSVQAASGILTDSDRAIIQMEVDQMLQGINDIARNTSFNNRNILDGSFINQHTASGPDGSGMTVSIPDMTNLARDLGGYSVIGTDSGGRPNAINMIDRVDDAMAAVSSTRAYLGGISNRADHTVNSNNITMLNQAAARSRIMELDVPRATTELSTQNTVNQYRIFMQRQQQEQNSTVLSLLS
jgi:flagellin